MVTCATPIDQNDEKEEEVFDVVTVDGLQLNVKNER